MRTNICFSSMETDGEGLDPVKLAKRPHLPHPRPHYANTPIQMYGKFHLQKTEKKKSDKISDIFIFLLKT